MPKKESIQQKLKRVRPPRVQITYDVEIGGAIEMKELPFVGGVLGDFSGQPAQQLPRVKDRKLIEIDRDNFDQLLAGMAPRLAMKVDNKPTNDGRRIKADLRLNRLQESEPNNAVQQVEPLRKLVEARQKLRDLLSKTDGNDRLEELLQGVMQNTNAQKQLSDALGLEGAKGKEKSEEGSNE